jgi:hypothetical protein
VQGRTVPCLLPHEMVLGYDEDDAAFVAGGVAIERPRVPDCPQPRDFYSPSRLERIARSLGAEPDDLRFWLRLEVDRLSRERASRHEGAHQQLDRRVGV